MPTTASYFAPVPASRTAVPTFNYAGKGYTAERKGFTTERYALAARLAQRQLFAVDFADDQVTNGRIVELTDVAKVSGLGAATIELAGVHHARVKFWLTGTTAGELELAVVAKERDGHEQEARVWVEVS